ncbi:hypothetical protein BSZ35_13675 [Salinibacter sp. 10B]|nr:hypothetical protein BSZ35_13675 [Salinibacter sp. 10B]
MSLFGPPENDPLLQNDLFASPHIREDPEPDDSTTQQSPSPRTGETSSPSRRIRSTASSRDEDLRILTRALADEWILKCVEFHPEGILEFVLHRPTATRKSFSEKTE